jgi:hypothetical protein
MTILQYLFNVSLEHIRQQKTDATRGTMYCYRTPDGRQCAAGPFIWAYTPDMENATFRGLVARFPDALDPLAVQQADWVSRLQSAHDDAVAATTFRGRPDGFMAAYEANMRDLAAAADLHYALPGQSLDTTRPVIW